MEKVHFTEEKATMLATLYGRALDSREADPVLGDHAADEAVRQIDYDFTKLGMTRDAAVSVVLRAKPIDDWAAEYLAAHPDAIVLHLGCGMDTRFQRLAPPETVHWYDVDYPEVVALREKLYAAAPNHTNIGTSVVDFGWLDQVPSDRLYADRRRGPDHVPDGRRGHGAGPAAGRKVPVRPADLRPVQQAGDQGAEAQHTGPQVGRDADLGRRQPTRAGALRPDVRVLFGRRTLDDMRRSWPGCDRSRGCSCGC